MLAASVKVAAAERGGLVAPWNDLKAQVRELLESGDLSAAWAERLSVLVTRLRQLTAQDVDVGLYMMLQTAINDVDHYSASHAMYCTVVADLCASWFEWPLEEVNALVYSALTMNLGRRRCRMPWPTRTGRQASNNGDASPSMRRAVSTH